MTTFTLPEGYSFEPPPGTEVQSVPVPGGGYGGADVSQAFDATGIHHVACNASGPGDPPFRWRAFKRVSGTTYVEVPLPFVATGRGEQDVQWYDGKDWGIAWSGNQFNFDMIPGFVPFPSIPSLAARIAVLEAGGVPAGGGTGGITLFPAPVTSTTWEGRMLEGGVMVDVPAVFGVAPASAYLIRFVAQASAANVRVRAGTQAAPFFLTMNLTVANMQTHIQGWAPGPEVYVSVVNGSAQVWLQIVGRA